MACAAFFLTSVKGDDHLKNRKTYPSFYGDSDKTMVKSVRMIDNPFIEEEQSMEKNRKLPIGIQNFEKIRTNGYLYVDKTSYVYDLVHSGIPYFLSRPRRFGKSLLLSTLKAYWEGKKELFAGLAIESLEKENSDAWQAWPVFYFDFNRSGYETIHSLEDILDVHLREWESIYHCTDQALPLPVRFQNLLVEAHKQTGKECVVLIDEYDKPLLGALSDAEIEEYNKAVFKGFFGTLKSYDQHIKFVFVTGITKFSKISIFSDLNQLQDISLTKKYANICGITDLEITDYLSPEVKEMADAIHLSLEDCKNKLKQQYDGYRFYPDTEGVYNPFSLLNALSQQEFAPFWYETGTPSFLIARIRETGYDAKIFTTNQLYADRFALSDFRIDNPDPVPLLYQAGYLTIKGYLPEIESYILGYPNEEVKYGFLRSLAPVYMYDESNAALQAKMFAKDIQNADIESLRNRFTQLFARLPYGKGENYEERDFQNVIYIVFLLLGEYVHTEVHIATGRADCMVETKDYIYLFEFKRDKSAKEALSQIEEKKYFQYYAADTRKMFRIGVNFDSGERNISEWVVQ